MRLAGELGVRFMGLYAVKQRLKTDAGFKDVAVPLSYAELKSRRYTPFAAACRNTLQTAGIPSQTLDLISDPHGHLYYVTDDQNGHDFRHYYPLFKNPDPDKVAAFWRTHPVHGTLLIRATPTGQTLEYCPQPQ